MQAWLLDCAASSRSSCNVDCMGPYPWLVDRAASSRSSCTADRMGPYPWLADRAASSRSSCTADCMGPYPWLVDRSASGTSSRTLDYATMKPRSVRPGAQSWGSCTQGMCVLRRRLGQHAPRAAASCDARRAKPRGRLHGTARACTWMRGPCLAVHGPSVLFRARWATRSCDPELETVDPAARDGALQRGSLCDPGGGIARSRARSSVPSAARD